MMCLVWMQVGAFHKDGNKGFLRQLKLVSCDIFTSETNDVLFRCRSSKTTTSKHVFRFKIIH